MAQIFRHISISVDSESKENILEIRIAVIKNLQQVKPKNVSNKTSGTGSSGMELWADCGKSARDVIGAGKA